MLEFGKPEERTFSDWTIVKNNNEHGK